jgi:hypothetical protein
MKILYTLVDGAARFLHWISGGVIDFRRGGEN